jgi:ATP-dependent DNA ligase
MIKPMLAHKFNPDKAVFPALLQPKLDGVRCVFTKDGAFSRTGKEFKNVDHIIKTLKPLFKKYPYIRLDGELYNHKLKDDFEKIISLVRKTKPTFEHRYEAELLVQYHIYDIVVTENGKLGWTYEERLDHLIDIIAEKTYDGHFIDNDHVRLTKTVYIKDIDEAKEWHTKFLNEGYEGSIYRNPDGLYKGTRSWDLMKFKDFHDAEAIIVGYELGKGKRTGTIGKFIMQDDEGVEFGCPPGKGYDYKDLAGMLDNINDYIGQRTTFTYFQRTQAGSYRHPLYKCIRDYE